MQYETQLACGTKAQDTVRQMGYVMWIGLVMPQEMSIIEIAKWPWESGDHGEEGEALIKLSNACIMILKEQ